MNGLFNIGSITPFRYYLCLALVGGIIFAVITKESAANGFALHLSQWILQVALAFALLVATHLALVRSLNIRALNPWLAILISGLIASIFFTFPALAIDLLLGIDTVPSTNISWLVLWIDEFTGVVWPVCIVWLATNAPWLSGFRLVSSTMKEEPLPSLKKCKLEQMQNRPHFAERVDDSVWGTILYLEAELQYVKVVTVNGESLVLYALRDAVSELPPEMGLQIHRSYWVAFNAIKLIHKQGRQGQVELVNGAMLPVSRSNLKRLQNYADSIVSVME